jgi:ATP-dependent exoDNAse (exonuclease V) beta subunit
MFERGSGKSKLERELNDRCDENDAMEDADAEVVVLTIELALRRAIAPRSVRWENIIVLVAEAKLE